MSIIQPLEGTKLNNDLIRLFLSDNTYVSHTLGNYHLHLRRAVSGLQVLYDVMD